MGGGGIGRPRSAGGGSTIRTISFPLAWLPTLEHHAERHGGWSGFFQFLARAFIQHEAQHGKPADPDEWRLSLLRAQEELAAQDALAAEHARDAARRQRELAEQRKESDPAVVKRLSLVEVARAYWRRSPEEIQRAAVEHGHNPQDVLDLAEEVYRESKNLPPRKPDARKQLVQADLRVLPKAGDGS